jgi:hypothetical protein
VLGNSIESLLEMRPSVLAFSTSFCTMAEGTQLVTEFVVFPLSMVFLATRCFTCIYKSAPGGYAQEEQEAEIDNGGGGEKELINSTNPHYSFIYLLGEGTWAET